MQILEQTTRPPALIRALVALWEDSVRATHDFLTEADIAQIKRYVPDALAAVPHLIVAADDDGAPLAFMGLDGTSLEMLFVVPAARGQGIGRRLLEWAMAHHGADRLTVNEDNPQARGFYEHLGFVVTDRSPIDDQGRPFPILTMTRQN